MQGWKCISHCDFYSITSYGHPSLNSCAVFCSCASMHTRKSPAFSAVFYAAALAGLVGARTRYGFYSAFNEPSSYFITHVQNSLAAGAHAIAIILFVSYSHIARRLSSNLSYLFKPLPGSRVQPQIFSYRTTHTRLFLQSHSVAQFYLYAGIPVEW